MRTLSPGAKDLMRVCFWARSMAALVFSMFLWTVW